MDDDSMKQNGSALNCRGGAMTTSPTVESGRQNAPDAFRAFFSCEQCQGTFPRTRPWQRFCVAPCRRAFHAGGELRRRIRLLEARVAALESSRTCAGCPAKEISHE